jgi:magnesium transporter
MGMHSKVTPRRVVLRRIIPGAPPGSLSAVPGSPAALVSVLTITQDGPSAPRILDTLSDLPVPKNDRCYWVRVSGLGALAPLQIICDFYGIQNMTLEDILNSGWRSKLEQSGEFLFLVLQAPPDNHPEAKSEHLFLLYKAGLIITFEDTPTSLIDTLWQRIASTPMPSELPSAGAYLAYAILDLLIDRFFPLLYRKDEELAELEDVIATRTPTREDMNKLHTLKHGLLTLRRLLTPYRELELAFRQIHIAEATAELAPYLNDLHDHITQAAELVESYHDIADSLFDLYQSVQSNHMNDIIKILTIISTVFMPLTFIAGVYGMNFHNMPELETAFGYPIVLGFMLTVVVGMIWFFRKRKWL